MITHFQFLAIFITTFTLVGMLTPLMRRVALSSSFLDYPNASHKSHSEATPYLGGVAIILGILGVSYASIASQENMREYFWIANSILGPALILGLIGLIDDYKSLHPMPRFLAQSGAGVFTAIVVISTETLGNPTGTLIFDALITLVWIVGICNSINFFDNVDGGAAGAVAVASLGVGVISFNSQQYLLSALSISVFAAMLGFLLWNKTPAKIYMGDAGSLFLGAVLAIATVRLNPNVESKATSFSIPLLLLAIPILDTTVAVVSRIRRGRSIFAGGRDHLSHRLIRRGHTKRRTAYLLWSACSTFATAATLVAITDMHSNLVLLTMGLFWVYLLIFFLKVQDE